MKQPLIIDATLLDAVSAVARTSPRRRQNRNFHSDDRATCHRLLNAIEPDSYLPPHRHNDPAKGEGIIVLRGRIGAVFFDDEGGVTGDALLEPGGAVVGIDVPSGTYHTVLALDPGTVIFETKAGPYMPLGPDEHAPWTPAEGAPDVAAYLQTLRNLFLQHDARMKPPLRHSRDATPSRLEAGADSALGRERCANPRSND